jgi:hypothetical protein
MSKSMPLALLSLIAAATLCSCASQINYLGESYPPTANVEFFFSSADIKRPYKIMGKAIATPGVFSEDNAFQNDIMMSARMHGADAILVESYQKLKTGQYTSWNSNGDASTNKSGRDVWWGESGSANTQDTTELRATIYFIKYLQQ